MKTFDEMSFHPDSEKLVEILCKKTQNTNPLFFRVMVAYYFAQAASMMRATVCTQDRGEIPVNMYAINLATSGFGKGYATNVLEDQVMDQFRHNFVEHTLPAVANIELPKLALVRAARNASDPDEELKIAENEYKAMGPMLFSFNSATPAAIGDIRHKLLMINLGSLNLNIDEIGLNLGANLDPLTTYLELYDMGKLKSKLTKNTSDNKRREEIQGRTPANALLFGTPDSLLDGSKTEDDFNTLLAAGYPRRALFGFEKGYKRDLTLSVDEIWAQRTSASTSSILQDLSDRFGDLADLAYANRKLHVDEPVSKLFIEYHRACSLEADKMPPHAAMLKAEMEHRYFKAIKLAGAYAFVDGSPDVTEDHAYYAIKLVEQSGKAFRDLLTRERDYVKLAHYIADCDRSVTQHDLVADLPFYKGSASTKAEMMTLAIAYGYQNEIIIKKAYTDGVEFLRGETLKRTDLNALRVSYSQDISKDYLEDVAKWDELHLLTQMPGYHWCNHYFMNGHRAEDDAIPGFNLLVIDVDHGTSLSTAKLMLEGYKALFYTTRRSTPQQNRFRIILPMSHELKLDAKDHKEFWENVYAWLPFDVDHASSQRCRKWLSHKGHYEYQDGELVDILPFIPKTTKNETFKQRIVDQRGLGNLERWVINNSGSGNRNNMLLRFCMILVDAGYDYTQINQAVCDLNDKMPDRLEHTEITTTVMVTVMKAIAKRDV
jgi:hypothetical protein